ncbi:MAG TPA: ferritin-like domain-containing protein [Solirubrobacteraceae bacterium]|nr:ferritin-like domain-containing protein [Solirubrobacteraceae bacterium]
MHHKLNLRDIDVDGAVRETASEAMEALDGDTRSSFLRRAGLAGGAMVGGGALLGALAQNALAFSTGDRPPAKFGAGDIGILNYALTLEYLESSFYNEATSNQHKYAFIKDYQTRIFLSAVTGDENEHVKALKKVLGSHAVQKPKFDFHGDTSNETAFQTAAFTFENLGVHAYSGQAFNIKNPKVLAAALSIVTVEARHASVIGLIRNRSDYGITPNGAFDKPLGASKVLAAVNSTHYIQS